ncbi:hypothetical protein ACB092_06G257900 [Castanea dentata]
MAEEAATRYAVVTGSNKGIGFETVRPLASKGVKVVLTARDEKKGLEAVQKLKDSGLSDLVLFHQLDVGNPANIASLADFINTRFGRLDILVNNAGIVGAIVDCHDSLRSINTNAVYTIVEMEGIYETKSWRVSVCVNRDFCVCVCVCRKGHQQSLKKPIQTYESVKARVETNYYGAKKTAEALIPLLQLSDSPRIVNVSSSAAKFVVDIPNELVRGVFTDPKNLTEENVEEVLSEFLKDFKEGSLETKGWGHSSAYVLSKAALNAYTKILAKRYPSFCINCVCPGFVKTDINWNTGKVPIEEGAAHPVRLALLPKGGPSGLFFVQQELSPFLF